MLNSRASIGALDPVHAGPSLVLLRNGRKAAAAIAGMARLELSWSRWTGCLHAVGDGGRFNSDDDHALLTLTYSESDSEHIWNEPVA